MDEKLHIVQHLYGEGGDPGELHRAMQDDAVRQEYEALRETKQYLDQRPAARPDPLVIDRVVAASAFPKAGVNPGRRKDRPARRNRARHLRLTGAFSAALALVLVVGIGLSQFWQQREMASAPAEAAPEFMEEEAEASAVEAPAPTSTLGATTEAEDSPARARKDERARTEETLLADEARTGGAQPVLEEAAPVDMADAEADDVALEMAAEPIAAPPPAALAAGATLGEEASALRQARARPVTDSIPTWDEADELLRVHGRLEIIRARSRELIWDESAVMSLDSLPTQPSRALPGLDAAGKKQQPRRQN